jgi:hypothetical protein
MQLSSVEGISEAAWHEEVCSVIGLMIESFMANLLWFV